MKSDYMENERVVSELATLSNDPALAAKRDPRFRAQFRNADETMEGDFEWKEVGSYPRPMSPSTAVSAFCRRSPKE